MELNATLICWVVPILAAVLEAAKKLPVLNDCENKAVVFPILSVVLAAIVTVADWLGGVTGATNLVGEVVSGVLIAIGAAGGYDLVKAILKTVPTKAAALLAGMAVLLSGCSLAGTQQLPVFMMGGQLIEGNDELQERLLDTAGEKLRLQAEIADRDLDEALERLCDVDGKVKATPAEMKALMAGHSRGVAERTKEGAELARLFRRIRGKTRGFIGASAGSEAMLQAERKATSQREAIFAALAGIGFGRYGDLD